MCCNPSYCPVVTLGPAGKLKSAGERCGVAHCLTIIARGSWDSQTSAPVASEVVDSLAALFEVRLAAS